MVAVSRETEQLRELLDLVGVSPALRARLSAVLRWHENQEAGPHPARRAVEAVDRELLAALRHPLDPDRFLEAVRAGSP
jgi:hypothetical protein